jgi:hypothetical protein
MSEQISRDRVRLEAGDSVNEVVDQITSAQPAFFVRNDLQVEIAQVVDGDMADVTNVATVTCEIHPLSNRVDVPLMSKTIGSGDMNAALTIDEWRTKSSDKWHALFPFTNEETALLLDADEQDFWLVVYALTGDVPTRKVTWCVAIIKLVDDGSLATAPPPALQPIYLTVQEADARYTVGTTKVSKTGDTMTGLLSFSGTDHAGIKLNSLTTTERDALSSPAAGMLIYNATTGGAEFRGAGGWKRLVTSVNGFFGDVTLTTADVAEVTNQYFTAARVRSTVLTGFASGAGVISAADTVLTAINKLSAMATSGTVTSVALTAPAFLSVAGSPVTSTGTLALSLATQTANTGFMGPTTGSAAAPTFRALVAADIPALAESAITNLTTDLAAKLALAGGTMTGALNLVAGTPTSNNAVSRTAGDALYLLLAGGTMTGTLNTLTVVVNSSNSISWATAPSSASHLANKTYVDTKASLSGATFTGGVAFSGTSNPGLTLNSLTSTQVSALSPAAGMVVYNTTISAAQVYNGTWQTLGGGGGGGTTWLSGSGVPSGGLGSNGDYYLDLTNADIYLKSAGSWSIVVSHGLAASGGTLTGTLTFDASLNPAIDFGFSTTLRLWNSHLNVGFRSGSDEIAYSGFENSTHPAGYHWFVPIGGVDCRDGVWVGGTLCLSGQGGAVTDASGTLGSATSQLNSLLAQLRATNVIDT